VIARVASITNTHAWAKAGVMIRETLTADSKHALVVTSISKGYAFQRRQDVGDYSVHTSGGTGTAPGWVRLVRTGDLFEAYRSANGTTWTRIGSDTIPMGTTVYAGLAVTSHNAAAATTAVIDNFRVTTSTGGNQPPAVSITAPANGSQPTVGTAVTIQATASDPESKMASVDFYAGSTLIVRDTTAPYSASWVPSAAGNVSLTATAHDQDGGSTTSAAVTVSVRAGTTTPPRLVVFTAPADHATNVTSYLLKVFAAGANPATATPVATSNLGKPTPSGGEITVDRASFFSALAAGSYQATVTAIGPGGQSPSAAVTFTR
jgi:Bacterial Ig domain